MILMVHMIFGAAVGYKVYALSNSFLLAAISALIAHYFLDFFPHIEYDIDNIANKQWKKSLPDFLMVFLDFLFGIIILFLLSKNHLVIFTCAAITILPDGLTLLTLIFPHRALLRHHEIHGQKIQFLKYKKISTFWRISTQIIALAIGFILLKI